jgi:DNA-binding PadR family transcriptional regulator
MSVPMTLLGLLHREPSHGYDLKRDYDAYFGRGKPLPYGQVHATLSRLARDGMAIVGPAEHGEGPDRKRYIIAGAGVEEVERWLREQRMRELTELKHPDGGEVRFNGQRIDALEETQRSELRRDKFGFVFQFGQLVSELTAEENVALPLLQAGALTGIPQ